MSYLTLNTIALLLLGRTILVASLPSEFWHSHLTSNLNSPNGKVVLATSINGKIVGQLEYETDLETVAFPQDAQLGYFALGTLSGSLTIWDLGKQMVRHHCAKSDEDGAVGVTKMIWVKNHLITGCLDGSIRGYEGNSGAMTLMLTGHNSEVLDLSYNEKENLILTASDDGTARIFKYVEKNV